MNNLHHHKFFADDEFHDACGIGFVAELTGEASRRVIELSIEALKRMSHRGASAADDRTGDGAGLLVDIPVDYFKMVVEEEFGKEITEGQIGIGMVFTTERELPVVEDEFAEIASEFNLDYIGRRSVPVNHAALGKTAKETCPEILQFFFLGKPHAKYDFETRLYILRKIVEQKIRTRNGDTFVCSLSSRTIVYKGLMQPGHLTRFYFDLTQPEFKARVALFHERFSTNTISNWSMAQPFRMLGHNGEINTIKGNRLWMQTREETIQSNFWEENLERLRPVVSLAGSDSYSLDNILEFLVRSGRGLFESIMMLIPEPYGGDHDMLPALRDFYIYHENHIEPWDGPAALVFCDGECVGAKLDRNGLRPLRYTVTKDQLVIMASEAGVVDIAEENILMHHHMKSGENFAIRLDDGKMFSNDEIIQRIVRDGAYSRMIGAGLIALNRGSDEDEFGEFSLPAEGFDKRLRVAFGMDREDLERFLIPMSHSARESVGSMGDDAPPAVISNQFRRLYDYFKQHFAQVTNPPIDSIRERYVMSLCRYIGSEGDLLSDADVFSGAIRIESPVLSPREVRLLKENHHLFKHAIVHCHFQTTENLARRIDAIRRDCEQAVLDGAKLIFLTDEGLRENCAPIPMLLMISAVHQHLVKVKLRNRCALLCLTGDAVEDHHVACLIAFGASVVYPYMAYELIREHFANDDWHAKMSHYRYALEKGLLKIMAKMGISTTSSYHGSMLFHAIGLSQSLIDEYFQSIKSPVGGVDLELLQNALIKKSLQAFSQNGGLQESGRFRFRKDGEPHGFSPTVFKHIHALSQNESNGKSGAQEPPVYLRDLLDVAKNGGIPLDQVEETPLILKRFGLGAVSFGAISAETHRTLARAATMLGIRSNTGEGGEQPHRYSHSNPDKSENCYTKQIASGRFGVTAYYLSAAREIQIKMGQGAKPGEGGQLPGEKVTLDIATYRHTTPGVPLISPPPHHDIYSIEDLAQLIYDLRQVNPRAQICVKLVSQLGIGIIAAGVVKAGADAILVSGHDGGTGASPLGSLKNTGLPWEIGLAEAHRTLLQQGLRNRVTLRVDGGFKNARDVIVAALFGAEEYDFGTSALVALGCVMARQCHLNTCPAGIATQDTELRKKFKGQPEHLVNYFNNVAEDIRRRLAEMGFYSLDEIIGRNELLIQNGRHTNLVETQKLSLQELIASTDGKSYQHNSKVMIKPAPAKSDAHIDEGVIEEARPAIVSHGHAIVNRVLKNTHRAVGSRLSGLIAFLYGPGEFKGHIQYRLTGSAGQSLGAFLVDNVEVRHCGVANDFVGKGMSGGLITIRFPKTIRKSLEGNTIIGNVALYGATGGELLVAGKAGERFAVRNSGAAAVVEGVGNHCCEYMTRGCVIVLGEIGKNFGAGMTGGVAFVYNGAEFVGKNINQEYVKVAALNPGDEDLLHKHIVSHEFHTGSTIADAIKDNWETEKSKFVKILPRAMDIVDFNKIYEEKFQNRLVGVFNE